MFFRVAMGTNMVYMFTYSTPIGGYIKPIISLVFLTHSVWIRPFEGIPTDFPRHRAGLTQESSAADGTRGQWASVESHMAMGQMEHGTAPRVGRVHSTPR